MKKTKLNVSLIEHTPNPERVVSNSARLCYSELGIEDLFGKFTDEQNKAMIDRLMSIGHESPLEHVSFTFGIEGISRSLSHQLVRHRIGASYSQKSQRYVSEGQFEYITPDKISECKAINHRFGNIMELLQENYVEISKALIKKDILEIHGEKTFNMLQDDFKWSNGDIILYSKNYSLINSEHIERFKELYPKEYRSISKSAMENARAVLPNACETKIIVTMNARALMNFFSLRCCRRAQGEIMNLADAMLLIVKDVAPNLFKYAGASCMFGKCTEGDMSCGLPRKPEEYEVVN